MIFKQGQLVAILGCSQALESKYLDPINAACTKFNINTMLRLAAFIAQVGHESGRLATTVENLNYSADGLVKTWPSRFTAASAAAVARQPQKIANIVYASRMGNGNEASGDGWKYRGRGLIQVTGKSNYDAYSQASGFNAIANPDALAEAVHASMSAGWFWDSKGLNPYADRSDFLTITKRINGGTNGQADRELLYKKAIIVLSGGVPPKDDVVDKAPLPVPPDGSPTSPVTTDKTPGAQNSSIVEPRAAQGSESKSKYPWNFVNVSRSGHVSEVDDTPGYERLNMTHRTGSYWEIDNTGTYTTKSILDAYKLTKYDSYDYVGGNYTQQIKGQSYVQTSGDMIIKCGGVIYFTTNKVQMNVGMLAVSGEINAPNINATIFSGMSGLAFGDMLAKEAMVAYDIKKGKAPMLGQSLGFKSAPGATESGSADGLMPNTLDKKAPNGTPWITNGISTAVGVVTVATMAAGVADLFKKDTPSKELENAINSAASDIDKAATQSSKETPVFVKHVSFAKPTLISQSTTIDKPDASLYVNNIHTIVSSNGKGRLHMSNGVEWIPIGDAAAADHEYTDEQIAIVIDKINQNEVSTTNKILAEAQERAAAILNEATQRQLALEEEARARQQQITSGLLAEATARGAAIQAESVIRQNEDESLSNRILELTASSSAEIAAAIAEERQARTTAIEAEAFKRETLAAKVDQNTASISDEVITRSNETSALSNRITTYIASNDASIASFKTEINAKVDDQGNALSSRIDTQTAANEANKAAIISESTARASADGALGTRIDTVFASTESNRVAIQTETTARTSADTALGTRIDTLTATVTGGLRTGINVLSNAGFMISDFTDAALPLYWSLETSSTDSTAITPSKFLLSDGPDGYKYERITVTPSKTSSQIRFGLKSTTYPVTSIRLNTDYIFAVRVRTSQDATVGKLLNITPSNYPFSFLALTDMVITKEWKWFIITCKWTIASQTLRDFYITYGYGNASPVGVAQSIDIATPMVAEGTTFLGFNMGTDQRILINTATITSEQTVRANADSALSSRIDTVSSQTTNAQAAADSANTAAANAQTAANNAKAAADAANALISNISSDNIISPNEKPDILREWQVIFGEVAGIVQSADNYVVNRDTYFAAYGAVRDFIAPISTELNNIPGNNISINGATMRTVFGNYYIQKQALLNAIADKSKSNVTAANAAAVAAKTAADTAQVAANIANAELTNIASDNILSKGEKPDVILQWQRLSLERPDINAKAAALSVSYTDYTVSITNLSNYLTSLGTTQNDWSDVTKDTPFVGDTFRTYWRNYFTERQLLLNAIAAKAATLANWDGVNNKPLDNTNLVITPSFEDNQLRSWTGSGATVSPNGLITPAFPNKYFLSFNTRDTLENNKFPVTPGDKLFTSAYFYTGSANYDIVFGVAFLDANGASLSNLSGSVVSPKQNAWIKSDGILTVPSNAVYGRPWVQINGSTNLGGGGICNMIISRTQLGATVGATWGVDVNGSAAVDQQVTNAINAANAAQSSANTANTELANIASDNVLAKSEKPPVILQWDTISGELNNIRSQADAFGVSRTAYDTSYQDLQTYLAGIGPGGTGGWSNTAVDSIIVGATFRSKWANYYTARTNILNAITTRAKALADQGIATNAASIVNEATARTNGDSANATAIQTVSTTVAGHTSTISQQQSSIQGVQANYGIKINNNGYVSGFGLLSEPVNGNIVSAFNILADKFAIQAPNLNGGTPVVPFSVDSTTTPPTISLNGLIRIGGASDGTGGKNILYNSGPSPRSVNGYAIGYQSVSPAQTPAIGLGFDTWRPTGAESVYYNYGGSPTGVCDLMNSNKGRYYPVVGGTKYEFSVYISAHRCTVTSLIIFLDGSGNNVGEYTGNLINGNGTIVGSGALSNWPRTSIIVAAPATAVKCHVGVRTNYSGQVGPYTFASMWYFGTAGVNQTNASPWSPAGVTTISGGQIETDSLSAMSAIIGVLETRPSGARVQIRDDVIKVFNDSNVSKIKIGNLTL